MGASSTIYPENLTITGKTKGSNIIENVSLRIPYSEKGTVALLREFTRLQSDLGSRNKDVTELRYGPQGGSRLNYRAAPMWSQNGGHTTFESNNNQYTEIHLEN